VRQNQKPKPNPTNLFRVLPSPHAPCHPRRHLLLQIVPSIPIPLSSLLPLSSVLPPPRCLAGGARCAGALPRPPDPITILLPQSISGDRQRRRPPPLARSWVPTSTRGGGRCYLAPPWAAASPSEHPFLLHLRPPHRVKRRGPAIRPFSYYQVCICRWSSATSSC
jgi:hypothetical protein